MNPDYYKSAKLRWKINGPEQDVMNGSIIVIPGVIGTNRRTLKEKDNILRGLHGFLEFRLTQYTIYSEMNNNTNTDVEL